MGSVMMHLQESRTTQDQTRMIFTRIIKGSLHNTDSHPNQHFKASLSTTVGGKLNTDMKMYNISSLQAKSY